MRIRLQRRQAVIALAGSLLCVLTALAEDNVTPALQPENAPEGCFAGPVSAKPTRPNFSYSTDTTQCGVVEVDYGWTSQSQGAGIHQNLFSSGFRLGLTPALDFRWGSDNYVSETAGSTFVAGTGDNWLGARYRFHDQTANTPAMGLSYGIKLPTASPVYGLGSGYVDHAFTLLASKDIRKYHFDFNAVGTLAGAAKGFDHGTMLSLACWRPITKRLSAVAESHGGSQPDGSRYAAVLTGASYSINPKLVLDAAFESAVTSGAPRRRLLIGATYAIGHLSSLARPRAGAIAASTDPGIQP